MTMGDDEEEDEKVFYLVSFLHTNRKTISTFQFSLHAIVFYSLISGYEINVFGCFFLN